MNIKDVLDPQIKDFLRTIDTHIDSQTIQLRERNESLSSKLHISEQENINFRKKIRALDEIIKGFRENAAISKTLGENNSSIQEPKRKDRRNRKASRSSK